MHAGPDRDVLAFVLDHTGRFDRFIECVDPILVAAEIVVGQAVDTYRVGTVSASDPVFPVVAVKTITSTIKLIIKFIS